MLSAHSLAGKERGEHNMFARIPSLEASQEILLAWSHQANQQNSSETTKTALENILFGIVSCFFSQFECNLRIGT